jgi:hypothetical protein
VLDNGNAHMNGNGSANGAIGLVPVAAFPPPIATVAPVTSDATPETLIFRAGLLTPDQLGELVQERVSSGRSVEQIVVERGWADLATVSRALGLEAPAAVIPALPAEVSAPTVEFPSPPAVVPAPPVAVNVPPPAELVAVPVEVLEAPVELLAVPVEVPALPAVTSEPAAQIAVSEPEPQADVTESAPLHVISIPVIHPSVRPAETQVTELEFRVLLRFVGNDVTEIARFDDGAAAKESAHAIAAELAGAHAEWPFLAGRFVRPEAVLSVDVDAIVR